VAFTASGGEQYRFLQDDSLVQAGPQGRLGLRPSDSLTLKAVVIDTNGCRDTSATLRTAVDPLPNAGLSVSPGVRFCADVTPLFIASGGGRYRFFRNGRLLRDSSAAVYQPTDSVVDGDTIGLAVIDSNGCRADTGLRLSVDPLPPIALRRASSGPLCPGDTATFIASGAQGYTFRRNGREVQRGRRDTFTTALLANGDVIAVEGVDANGCTGGPVSVRVSLRPAPSLAVSPKGRPGLCPGDSLTLRATAGLAGYRWSTGDTGRRLVVDRPGTYRVRTSAPGATCPAVSRPVEVLGRDTPPARIDLVGGDTVLCPGDTALLSGPAGLATYQWSTGATSRRIRVSQGGRYSLRVSDSVGCRNRGDTSLSQRASPRASILTLGVAPCTGDSLGLSLSQAFDSLRWNTGDTTPSIVVTRADTFFARLVDRFGCVGSSDSIVPGFQPRPSVAIQANGPLAFCPGDSVVLSADTAYAAYRWSNGERSPSIVVSSSDTVVLAADNAAGCTGRDTVVVQANPPGQVPVALSGDSLLCPGDSVILTAAAGYSAYQWSTGDTTRRIVTTDSGRFRVTAGPPACRQTSRQVRVSKVAVAQRPGLRADGPLRFCRGDSVRLTAEGGFRGYRWNNGTPGRALQVRTAGRYFVSVEGPQGCRIPSDTLRVQVDSQPRPAVLGSDPAAFCAGDSLVLRLSDTLASIRWNTGDTTAALRVTQSGSYFAEVTDARACRGFSDTVTVTRRPAVTLAVVFESGPVICAGDSARVRAVGRGLRTYRWSNGDSTPTTAYGDTVRPRLTARDSNGCRASAQAPAAVERRPAPAPTIAALGDTVFCVGDSVRLVAQGGGGPYRWSNGQVGDTIALFATQKVSVSQANPNGCRGVSAPFGVRALEAPVPDFRIEAPAPLCQGDTARLVAEGSFAQARWSDGQTGARALLTQTDTLRLRVANAAGCAAQSPAIVTTFQPVPDRPVLTGLRPVLCQGDTLRLSPTQAYARYRWNTGDTSRGLRVTEGGRYRLTVINTQGCRRRSAPAEIDQQIPPDPRLELSPSRRLFCAGDTLRLQIEGRYDRYRWSDGVEGRARALSSDRAALSVEVQEGACTGRSDTVAVRFVPQPDPSVRLNGETTFCQGEAVRFSAQGASEVDYRWNTGAEGPVLEVTTSGSYRVTATRRDSLNGETVACSQTSVPQEVAVLPRPEAFGIQRRGDTLLGPQRSDLQYQWLLDGTPIAGATEPWLIGFLSGTYSLEVTNAAGCSRQASDSVALAGTRFSIYPNPTRGPVIYEVRLERPQEVAVEVFNNQGQLVRRTTEQMGAGLNRRRLELTGLRSGMYHVWVESATEVIREKIILR
jgi:hypothetical protein